MDNSSEGKYYLVGDSLSKEHQVEINGHKSHEASVEKLNQGCVCVSPKVCINFIFFLCLFSGGEAL